MLKAFEAYYPETLKRAYLVSGNLTYCEKFNVECSIDIKHIIYSDFLQPAPWVFSILWSIAKPFISTATHERLRFLSSDKEVWKAEFTQFVDEDQLPESFGGTLPDDYQVAQDDLKMHCGLKNVFDLIKHFVLWLLACIK